MRKIILFLIIVLVIVAGVSAACAYSPSIKSTVAGGLSAAGGSVWTAVSTGWSNLATTVGSSGTYFLIYTCGVGLLFIIMFLLLQPRVPQRFKKVSTPIPLQRGPDVVPGSVIQQTAKPIAPTPNQPTPTPEKEEVEAS